jgi:hypothetical protein
MPQLAADHKGARRSAPPFPVCRQGVVVALALLRERAGPMIGQTGSRWPS